MSKIVFSKHARNQIIERQISEEEIISTLLTPDKTVTQSQGKFQAVKVIKKDGKKYLIVVVYRKINLIKKVITAFLTTKFKKYF